MTKKSTIGLVIKTKKGPVNKPIIFDTIIEGVKYIKKYNTKL